MNSLPYEVKLNILIQAGYPGLLDLCYLDKSLYHMCQDDYLWSLLVSKDFPDLHEVKPIDMDYQQYFQDNYYWSHKLFRDYPSLYFLRQNGITFEYAYQSIEEFIRDTLITMAQNLNITFSVEVLLNLFKTYSNEKYITKQKLSQESYVSKLSQISQMLSRPYLLNNAHFHYYIVEIFRFLDI